MQSTTNETQTMLTDMDRETTDITQSLSKPPVNTVGGWFALQYAATAKKKLTALDDDQRWKLLREVAWDWPRLSRGEQIAERMQITRDQLDLSKQNAERKRQNKIDAGLECLGGLIIKTPQAAALYQQLRTLVQPGPDATQAESTSLS